jgi:3-oxoadipate enol-lactonase/4-carboxymuconolactone decarboxylase
MPTDQERLDQGMAVRRAVLSDAHVDRALASTTELTADWQDFITRVAWGDIWSRPGLDRRSRSIAVLSSLIAHGHHEELAMHLRAALRNGLSVDEIREVILQSAVYSGVPAANTAFRIASEVFAQDAPVPDGQGGDTPGGDMPGGDVPGGDGQGGGAQVGA